MKNLFPYLTFLFLGFLIAGDLAKAGSMDKANALLRREKWSEAVTAFEKITRDEPDNDHAWSQLAVALEGGGNHERAVEVAHKVATFPRFMGIALYHIARDYASKGQTAKASETLQDAMASGYMDYDAMKSDEALASLRKHGLIDFAPKRNYQQIRAENGISIRYDVVLPENYDKKKTYPTMILFSSGSHGPLSTDYALSNFVGEGSKKHGWIVVCPVAPERGWFTHPSHHALEDLFDHIGKRYHVKKGDFHLAGFGSGGYPATTYSVMSRPYFQSLTVAASYTWSWHEDRKYRDYKKLDVYLFVGGQDDYGVQCYRNAEKMLRKNGANPHLSVVSGETYLLEGLFNGGLFKQLNHIRNTPREVASAH